MKFIELFAGIGGLGYGLMKAGMECVGYCEIDKCAHKAFQILHDPEGRMWDAYDIRGVTDDDIRLLGEQHDIDIISGGFPCQSFSQVGLRLGFADQIRGTLFFEIVRFASILKPKYLLLENVKGLLNHDGGRTFATILCALDELGYDCEWQLLNSKDFGVPQNRERVFIIGHFRTGSGRKIFPISGEITVQDKHGIVVFDAYNQRVRRDGMVGTLTGNCGKKGNNGFEISDGFRLRKLTPLECFRLQSWPDEWYHTLKENGTTDSQLYKQAGNGVTSVVAYEIGRRIMQGVIT